MPPEQITSLKLELGEALDEAGEAELREIAARAALDGNYTIKGWNLYYGLEWVGKTDSYAYLEEDPATSTFKLNTPDHFEHAISLSYNNTAEKWRVTAGVRNLADKKPPVISAQAGYNRVGNAPLFSGYDYFGRRFFVNVTKTF